MKLGSVGCDASLYTCGWLDGCLALRMQPGYVRDCFHAPFLAI